MKDCLNHKAGNYGGPPLELMQTTEDYRIFLLIIITIVIKFINVKYCYIAETWKYSKHVESKLISMKMDFFRRDAQDYKNDK